MTRTHLALTTTQLLIGAALALSALLFLAQPTHAASYAFVNTSGEVSVVNADTPEAALSSAINIAIHSGVMLLQSQLDAVVGDHTNL